MILVSLDLQILERLHPRQKALSTEHGEKVILSEYLPGPTEVRPKRQGTRDDTRKIFSEVINILINKPDNQYLSVGDQIYSFDDEFALSYLYDSGIRYFYFPSTNIEKVESVADAIQSFILSSEGKKALLEIAQDSGFEFKTPDAVVNFIVERAKDLKNSANIIMYVFHIKLS